MRFQVEDHHPVEWISGNEPAPPLPECERVAWPKNDPSNPHNMDGADYFIEVGSLEELLNLGKIKKMNIFINLEFMRIVFTNDDEPE